MIVRGAQLEAFKTGQHRSFEDRMLEHLNTHFPENCEALGEQGVRQAIEYGINGARAHQINTERDLCKYITLLFAFGKDFDRDPNLRWAAEILQSKVYASGTDRIEALYRAAKRYVRETSHRSTS